MNKARSLKGPIKKKMIPGLNVKNSLIFRSLQYPLSPGRSESSIARTGPSENNNPGAVLWGEGFQINLPGAPSGLVTPLLRTTTSRYVYCLHFLCGLT